jgi:hypothetical protein
MVLLLLLQRIGLVLPWFVKQDIAHSYKKGKLGMTLSCEYQPSKELKNMSLVKLLFFVGKDVSVITVGRWRLSSITAWKCTWITIARVIILKKPCNLLNNLLNVIFIMHELWLYWWLNKQVLIDLYYLVIRHSSSVCNELRII